MEEEEEMMEQVPWQLMPPEIWHCVCEFLSTADIYSLSYVNSRFYYGAELLKKIKHIRITNCLLHEEVIPSADLVAYRVSISNHLTLVRASTLQSLCLTGGGYSFQAIRQLVDLIPEMRLLERLELSKIPLQNHSSLSKIPRLLQLHTLKLVCVGKVLSQHDPSTLSLKDLLPLKSLRVLSLADIDLHNADLSDIGLFPNLTELDLSGNTEISSRLLEPLKLLKDIVLFDVTATGIRGTMFWLHLGQLRLRNEDYPGAVAAANSGLAISETDGSLLWCKASALTRSKLFLEALPILDSLAERIPSSLSIAMERGTFLDTTFICPRTCLFQYRHFLGKTYRQLKRYQQSIVEFNRALVLRPDSVEAYWRKGGSLIKVGLFQDAIFCFDEAIRCRGDSSRLIMNYYEDADVERELCLYKKDLVQFLRGDAYYDMGNTEEALHCWYQAIQFPEGEVVPPFTVFDNYAGALIVYDRALAINSQDNSAWYTRGMVQSALKDHTGAIKSFDTALEIDSTFVAAIDRKGESYRYLGDFENSYKLHHSICYSVDTMRVRSWVNLVILLIEHGKHKQALEVLTAAEEQVGSDSRLDTLRDSILLVV